MHQHNTITCKVCKAKIASRDDDGLTFSRGQLQATINGSDYTVSIVCYRCKGLNVCDSRPAISQRISS